VRRGILSRRAASERLPRVLASAAASCSFSFSGERVVSNGTSRVTETEPVVAAMTGVVANGGAVVKQNVAVNDKNGDLRVEVQGAKAEAPKANEPAKSDAKPDNDGVLKKLQDASKDAGITAEAAPAVEETTKPEKPYIPETAAADETDANVLDGNGSAAFKPARFASSGSGSAAYEQSKGGQSSGATTSGNASNGSTVKVAKSGGKPEGLKGKASATPASGKAEIRKETAKTGGDGSKTETGNVLSSDNKNTSETKGETGNSSTGNGETGPETTTSTPTVTPMMTNVDDTVSTVAATKTEEPRLFSRPAGELEKENARRKERETLKAKEEAERRMREQKRNALRQQYLQDLKNAFEKEADCDVDNVVAPSDRRRSGITSNDVMRLAAFPSMRAKEVTLDVDNDMNPSDLIALLKELGAKTESERNPNISFLLPNGTWFLDEKDTIPGVALKAQSSAMIITFPKAKPTASSKKKADGKKASARTTSTTGGAPKGKGDRLRAILGRIDLKPEEKTVHREDFEGTKQPALEALEEDLKREETWKETADLRHGRLMTKAERWAKRTYNGTFEPDIKGTLSDENLAFDLKNDFMNGDELLDGILKFNEKQAKDPTTWPTPILVVVLIDNSKGADPAPFVRLSADQTARAKGLIFITDGNDAKEAEKDTKRFFVASFAADGKTLAFIFVIPDDGTMSEKQREFSARLRNTAAFGRPKAETKDAGGDRLTAEIVIPKEVTDVLGEKEVFKEINEFLGKNPRCTTKIEMYYRDAKTLTEVLADACRDGNTLRLTLSFDNALPKNFEKDVNAEAALQDTNVSVKGNTVTFQKRTIIDENEVKTYLGTHASATIPKTFTSICEPEKVMEWVLNRTSDQPLRLDMSAYDDKAVNGKLTESLKKIAKDQNPRGLNLTIVIDDSRTVFLSFENEVNQGLSDDKRRLISIGSGICSSEFRFETPKEACQRRFGVTADNDGNLEVSDEMKQDIADGTVDGSNLINMIWKYNTAFPGEKISCVITRDLETEAFSEDDKNKGADCITFSADDIKSLPDVTFRLEDTTRLNELEKAGLKVQLVPDTDNPDETSLIVSNYNSSHYDDAMVKKIQNTWRNQRKAKEGGEGREE